jgi:hypothetical protein
MVPCDRQARHERAREPPGAGNEPDAASPVTVLGRQSQQPLRHKRTDVAAVRAWQPVTEAAWHDVRLQAPAA